MKKRPRLRPVVWRDGFAHLKVDEGVHVWPFDPVAPLAVQFLTFKGDQPVPANRHDYFEICVLSAGEMGGEVDGKPIRFRKGDVFVMGRKHPHNLHPVKGTARLVGLQFLREFVCPDWTGDKVELLKPFLLEESGGPSVIRGQRRLAADLLELMTVIGQSVPPQSVRERVLVRINLERVLALLVEHFGSELDGITSEGGTSKLERLRPLFDQLNRDVAERLSIAEAAHMVGMSGTAFKRAFKRATGHAFGAYLMRLRVARAQELLVKTDWKLSAIALHLGFIDQSHLGRVFRGLVGSTPRTYRESNVVRT